MKTTQRNTHSFDLTPNAQPLLDQLDTKLPASVLSRAAKDAVGLLMFYADQSAQDQAAAATALSVGTLGALDETSPDSVAVVVAAAALLTAAKAGRGTHAERIAKALDMLSDRYQADW